MLGEIGWLNLAGLIMELAPGIVQCLPNIQGFIGRIIILGPCQPPEGDGLAVRQLIFDCLH